MVSMPAAMKPLTLAAILLSVLCTAKSAGTNELAQANVEALIAKLGADTYSDRNRAEETLRSLPRTALPALRAHAESPDPEIRTRLGNVIAYLQNDPDRIPQTVWKINGVSQRSINEFKRTWNAALQDWHETAVTGEEHTNAQSGTGGGFAQSFKPNCSQIAAVGLYTYPVNNGWGWMRVDICEDDNGRPGSYVLARAWLKIEKGFHGSHSVAMLYDIPDVTVRPNGVYWVTFAEFRASDSPSKYLTNYGVSINNGYREGQLLRDLSSDSRSTHDAKFIIYAKCKTVPTLRQLGLDALDDIAVGKDAFKHWNELPKK